MSEKTEDYVIKNVILRYLSSFRRLYRKRGLYGWYHICLVIIFYVTKIYKDEMIQNYEKEFLNIHELVRTIEN